MKIDLAIPVLNEEQTLSQNVLRARDYIKAHLADRDVRLVIADNGSQDRTEEIGRGLAAAHPDIEYCRVPARGVGLAMKYTWSRSAADVVGYMDLDLATDLAHLRQVFDAIANGADIVYGSRLHRDAVVTGRSFKREVISRAFNAVLKVYLGARFSDGMCGFKFLRRAILPDLMAAGAVSDGWFFSTELLIAAQRLGYKLYELPVHWTDDPVSRVKVGRLTREYLRAMRAIKHYPVPPGLGPRRA